MKLELKFDNGVTYSLTIPRGIFNLNTKEFIIETFSKWLNEQVEILEEDKDIELLDVALLSQSDNWLWCPSKDDFAKDIELNSYIISNIRENTLNFQRN